MTTEDLTSPHDNFWIL